VKLWFEKIILVPYFTLQYGLFLLLCGIAVAYLFGGYFNNGIDVVSLRPIAQYFKEFPFILAVLALFLSRCVSFRTHYIVSGEYKHSTVKSLMFQPIGQIFLFEVIFLLRDT
jgi:ABC-type transport system involved in multi-copper enzyme maturation permease subunit